MSARLVRQLKPEEEELLRKREELSLIRATLSERELDLADLRSLLAAFEGRYLREVGVLYAELDEWKARIAELRAKLDPSNAAQQSAKKARDEARHTYDAAHGEAAQAQDFTPSAELKALFREAAKRMHPDFALSPTDLERRTRFMAEANRAYQAGDVETLQRTLEEFQAGVEVVPGEGIGAELVRIIRQISLAKDRIAAIEREIDSLRLTEIALLRGQVEECRLAGRDLLSELAAATRGQIELLRREFELMTKAS